MPDINIQFTVPSAKVNYFKNGWERQHPIPTDDDPNSPTYGDPLYGSLEWFKKCLIRYVKSEVDLGNQKLGSDAVVKETDVIS